MRVTRMIMAVVMRVRPMSVAVIVPMMVMVMVAVIMPVRAMSPARTVPSPRSP